MKTSLTRAGVAALAFAVLSVPAAAEVVKEEEAAFVTRTSAVVEGDERAAWMALITPAEWWSKSHTWTGNAANLSITPQAGGCFCEAVPGKDAGERIGLDGSVEHMRVIYAAPDQVLRMRGALGPLQSEAVTGVLTITLAKVPKGTRITFEYVVSGFMRFETPMIAKAVDGVLTEQLTGLARSLGAIELPKVAPPPAPKPDEPAKPAGDAAKPAGAATTPPATATGNRPAATGPAPAATGNRSGIEQVQLPRSNAAGQPAATPATTPATAPATTSPRPVGNSATPPATTPKPQEPPKEAPKPEPKISVDSAFGDLVDD